MDFDEKGFWHDLLMARGTNQFDKMIAAAQEEGEHPYDLVRQLVEYSTTSIGQPCPFFELVATGPDNFEVGYPDDDLRRLTVTRADNGVALSGGNGLLAVMHFDCESHDPEAALLMLCTLYSICMGYHARHGSDTTLQPA